MGIILTVLSRATADTAVIGAIANGAATDTRHGMANIPALAATLLSGLKLVAI